MPGLRGDFIDAVRKDMYKFERDGSKEVATMYDKIFKVVNGKEVKGAGIKATQRLSQTGLERHTAEGQNIAFRSPLQGWTTYCKYHTFSDGLTFSPEAVEDVVKLGDILKEEAAQWGREVRIAKEELGARVFNEGGNLAGDFVFNGSFTGEADPSGDLCYDSKPLFNLTGNARTTKGGQTYYNSVAAAYPSSGDITPAQFATIYNLMTATNNRDEVGRKEMNKPDTVLTKPGADHFAMQRILTSERLAGGELNDKNPYQGLIKNIYAWDYLDENAFYVGKAKADTLQFHERMAPEIRFFRHEDTAGYKASIRTRFGVWLRPQVWRDWTRAGGTSA
jgi:hypothetical protein